MLKAQAAASAWGGGFNALLNARHVENRDFSTRTEIVPAKTMPEKKISCQIETVFRWDDCKIWAYCD